MFAGLVFGGKVLRVLKEKYEYDPVGPGQPVTMRRVCKMIRKNGGNEYDAALVFMLSQLQMLSDDTSTYPFRRKMLNRALAMGSLYTSESAVREISHLLIQYADDGGAT
ncbi:hypothetical protein [Defluviimonas sp. SAOS-178_SWC]|uniref:hypothetical protein n=1 Tax=Defluviimonas sp. SAOS-178_SWC TaxID=3121287 RepID=UPI0032216AD0